MATGSVAGALAINCAARPERNSAATAPSTTPRAVGVPASSTKALSSSHRINPRPPSSNACQTAWTCCGLARDEVVKATTLVRASELSRHCCHDHRAPSHRQPGRGGCSHTHPNRGRRFEPGADPWIGGVYRIGPGANGAGKSDIHPLLEVCPGGEILVLALQRRVGGHRHHRAPTGKARSPFAIERRQAGVAGLQPNTKSRERFRCEVEIPGGGEVGYACFIRKVVEEGLISGVGTHMFAEPAGDAVQPPRIGKARRADEGVEGSWVPADAVASPR